MKKSSAVAAVFLACFALAMVLSVWICACCAAVDRSRSGSADEQKTAAGRIADADPGNRAAGNEDGDSAGSDSDPAPEEARAFPHELPADCSSWKEYRLRHPVKPEQAVLLRTKLAEERLQQSEQPAHEPPPEPAEPVKEELTYLDSFIATAYYLTGLTSTGAYTTVNRTLAVNPNVIPYGTHVWLWLDDGTYVGDYYAEDTGSNMMAHPYVIDIYMGNDYDACVQWGARRVLVYTE